MEKKYFKTAAVISVIILFSASAFTANAGHDEDFKRASDLDYYPGLTNLQSAQLDVNLASVIHQENLQIIQALQEIEERLNKLEVSIKTIEREVVGK